MVARCGSVPLSCLPERRLLVPLAALRLPPDTRRLEVAFLTSGH